MCIYYSGKYGHPLAVVVKCHLGKQMVSMIVYMHYLVFNKRNLVYKYTNHPYLLPPPPPPQELVLEKETRIRESMLMMGLKQWVLWTTWFIKQFLFLFVSSLIVAILLKVASDTLICQSCP